MITRPAVILVCLALAATRSSAQARPGASTAHRDSSAVSASGAFFALSVADLEASVRWYSGMLGLRVLQRMPEQGGVSVAVLEGDGVLVELVHHRGALRPPARPAGSTTPPGPFKVGLLVDDFQRSIERLRRRNVSFAYGPFPERPDQPANVIVRDNEGNLIQIIARRAR